MKRLLTRVLKGALIGSGFIIPGVSGGTLAVVFGVYERLIKLFSDIRKSIKEDWSYFLPIIIGAILGVMFFSNIVSFLLGRYEVIILWFFIGCILGTLPSLWKEAGKEGRSKRDIFIMIGSFIFGLILLKFGKNLVSEKVIASPASWMICGMLISLGTLIPGLSSSNFIVYMGLYKEMADGFKSLDFSVIIPIGIGAVLTIAVFIKLIEKIYKNHYSSFFHFILGIVVASTIMIIPTNYSGFGIKSYFACLVLLVLGVLLSIWMTRLEDSAGKKVV